jgi:hypothetical protein
VLSNSFPNHRAYAAALTYRAVKKAPVVSRTLPGLFALTQTINGHATWKVLIPLLVTLVSGLLGANWLMIEQRAAQPHPDSVHQREFERLVRTVERDLDEIKAELRTIRAHLATP